MKSESWVEQVQKALNLTKIRADELQRFCQKYNIAELRSSTYRVSYERAVDDMLNNLVVTGTIEETEVTLRAWESNTKPYVTVEAAVSVAGRELKIHNGRPMGQRTVSPKTEFSDLSNTLATALAKVFNASVEIWEYEGYGNKFETLEVVDESDHIEVAFNRLEEDC